ncbi:MULTISPECIES: family 20 glycosylhydrolase [unclassified Knoellia]|uniref:family 20 glycosylhydrolase n=1 Tax=Knoellia altitudinis TaxID=3404795 RepID=UPI00361D5982
MADAVNAKPVVIPALQQWTGGTGHLELTHRSRIVLAPEDVGALTPVASQLRSDLVEVTGLRALDVVHTDVTRAGDIVIGLDATAAVGPDTEVARAEGYTLDVGARATITSRTARGAFWATRSVLQILTGSGPRTTLPVGRTTDWPNYEFRGFMLDVGRRYFTPEYLRDYTTYLSWYKLNTFQIHLNDNAISAPDGDWSKAQSAFRLKSDNPRFAGLAADDGSYTRADWDAIEDNAAAHFVDIVPEIDAPAHSRAFIEFDANLGLSGGSSDHLDLTKPETTQFMKDVFSEFTPWFRGPTVHYGADEYPREYAAEYTQYFNEMAAHVRSLGKKAAAWGSFTVMSGTAEGHDRDVLINSWNNGWYGPTPALADGYDFVNTNDALLYIVPFASYYHGRGLDGPWLFASWTPRHFGGSNLVPEGEDSLKGAMSAVWNDLVDATYTQQDVHGLVEPTLGILAQKMWRGVEPGQTHERFMAGAGRLAMGPGIGVITPTLFHPGDPKVAVSLSTPPMMVAGASAVVDVTVRNNHDTALTRQAHGHPRGRGRAGPDRGPGRGRTTWAPAGPGRDVDLPDHRHGGSDVRQRRAHRHGDGHGRPCRHHRVGPGDRPDRGPGT